MALRFGIAAAAAAGFVAAYNNGLGAKPPMGWSTWCTDDFCGLLDYCNEEEVREMADAIVSSGLASLSWKLSDAPFLVLLDDCWASDTRDANGNLQPDPTRFPSGIAALAQYVNDRNLTLGLYTDIADRTCKYNRTGSGGHYAQDAAWFAAQGVRYVKCDWCGHGSEPAVQQYGNLSAALNATGVPIWFAPCDWGEQAPWTWGPTVAQSFRVGPDHLPFWSAPWQSSGQGVIDYINWMANLTSAGYHSAAYGWFDTDFLMTGLPTLSDTESETEFAFWSLFGGPMIVATDLRNLSAWKASVVLNADIWTVAQDAALGVATRVFVDPTPNVQVWMKPLANGDVAVILLNANDWVVQTVGVAWSQLGWPGSASVRVYDLWNHTTLGTLTSGYTRVLEPHSNAYLRLTRVA